MHRLADRSSPLLPVLRPLLRRLNAAVWLEYSLPAFMLLAGLWASGLLVLKILGAAWLRPAYAAGGLLLLAPVYGYWRSRRRGSFFAPGHGAELADHLFHNDGQVSAYFERPELYPGLDASAFGREIGQVLARRAPRLRPGYFLQRLAPVLVYVTAALLVPARPPLEAVMEQAATQALTDPIVERLEETKGLLPDERANELLADLEQLRESGEGLTREKWEALEQLEQRMQDALDQSRQATMNVAEAVQDLTEGPGFRDNPLAAAQSPQFNAALRELQNAMNLSSQMLPDGIMEQLRAAMEQLEGMCQGGTQVSGEDRDALMQCVQQLQQQLEQLLQEMGCDGEGMLAGRGGVDRGRGDAAMSFGSPEQLEHAQFDQDRLQNRFLSPEDMVDLGMTLLRPDPDPGKFSPGMMQSYEGERGQAVSRTRISPSQREVVGKYFSEP
jgi:hypothetical protein